MASKTLHGGHRERLRKRFLENGTNGFEEHELLELLLFYALPRVNTNELAHALINRMGSLSAVLGASAEDIAAVKGLNESSALFVSFMADLCRDYAETSLTDRTSFPKEGAEGYLTAYFKSVQSEICVLLSVSMKCEPMSIHTFTREELMPGGISSRSIAELVIRNRIRRIVIGQNRTGRLVLPCEEDYIITKTLSELLRPLGVEVYDHIICAEERSFSMRKSGAFGFCGGGDGSE